MRQLIQDHKNLVKVDGAFVVNEDDMAYRAALARRNASKKQKESEQRIAELERKLEMLMKLVEEK